MDYSQLTEEVGHPLLGGIATKRLDHFADGVYSRYNLSSVLARERFDDDEHVQMTMWSTPGTDKVAFENVMSHFSGNEPTRQLRKGEVVGKSWTHHWIHLRLNIPPSFRATGEPVIFEFDPSCEAMIFDMDGNVKHGITGGINSPIKAFPGYVEDRRVDHIIPRDAVEKGVYECMIEVSCNRIMGIGKDLPHNPPDDDLTFPLKVADLIHARSEAMALHIDFKVLTQLAIAPDAHCSPVAQKSLRVANQIMDTFHHPANSAAVDDAIKRCRALAATVIGSLDPADQSSLGETKIWAIGHCHIDTAWLWQYLHTQQKIARSWSTQVDLMERYPEHQFAASSAQQFVWLEELYPSLSKRVNAAVARGSFHPVGGSWIEHDCVLPSGESLCKQYLYGQRYFTARYGQPCREAWLPDTFGYAPQLPQILRGAGIEYFFTQKLSWNNINVFPYSTFNWCGLDGSQVLAHMTPTDTYNGQANYSELLKGIQRHKNLAVTDECLLLFGNGDGGGGPTSLMIEKIRRWRSLAEKNIEVPTVKIGKVADFFDHVLEKTHNGRALPTWRGELYFELHRGTFTSQAAIKEGNRACERLLRDVEYFATLASLGSGAYEYPKVELDAIWKDVLLNQFHDVLPGTSIRKVCEDAVRMYDQRRAELAVLLEHALEVLYPAGEGQLIALDATRIPRREVVPLGDLPSTSAVNGTGPRLGFLTSDASGVGMIAPPPSDAVPPHAYVDGETHVLENADFRVTIAGGRITSLIDRAVDRELVKPSPGAESAGLMLYGDLPLSYDAWDAEIYHLNSVQALDFTEVAVVNSGPLRATLRAVAKFGKSTATLDISLDAVVPVANTRSVIRIDASVDWHETHKFLKFALPVDIHSTLATYGTQYGLVERPTHRNTTLDQAKFEVCGHMLGDLSETGYGVAIVSDHKYGYAVEGNCMRLSLLRSAIAPDPQQDQGRHEFSFAVMPHVGRLVESGTYQAAMAFVNPVHLRSVGAIPEPKVTVSLEGLGAHQVVLDNVKRGEDDFDSTTGAKTLILRLYESLGGRASVTVNIRGVAVKAIARCNVLEEKVGDAAWTPVDGGVDVALNMRPFELLTLKVVVDE